MAQGEQPCPEPTIKITTLFDHGFITYALVLNMARRNQNPGPCRTFLEQMRQAAYLLIGLLGDMICYKWFTIRLRRKVYVVPVLMAAIGTIVLAFIMLWQFPYHDEDNRWIEAHWTTFMSVIQILYKRPALTNEL